MDYLNNSVYLPLDWCSYFIPDNLKHVPNDAQCPLALLAVHVAVHVANSLLENIFKCPKTKTIAVKFRKRINMFENGSIQNSHNLMLYV